jgi:hypothetical protein
LKSKPNGSKVKRWETYVGIQKRRKIRDIVLSSGTFGISASKINTSLSKQGIKISKQQLNDYLKQECSAGRFYKSGTKYVVDSLITFDDWSIFADYITRIQYFTMFSELPVNNCLQQEFNDDMLEDALLKFSSRLGALISYVIIEALRPTEYLKLQQHRQQIALRFVKDSISPENLLQSFLAALPYNFRDRYRIGVSPELEIVKDEHGAIVKDEHGNFKKFTIRIGDSPELEIVADENSKTIKDEHGNFKKFTIKNNNIAPEINQFYINKNQNPLQDLINAYNRIYPKLYDLFEKGYREYVSMTPEARCDHEWETINIHKIGEGYRCHKCLHTIEKEAFKRVFLK